jgi:hypothetical protein
MDPLPSSSGLDPDQAATVPQFVRLLKKLHVGSGLSYRAVVNLAEQSDRNNSIAPSTISLALKGEKLPTMRTLKVMLAAYSLPAEQADKWLAKWSDLARQSVDEDGLPTGIVMQIHDGLTNRLARVDKRTEELHLKEARLRADLAAARKECENLHKECMQLNEGLNVERERASKLEAERILVERHIGKLESELSAVRDELRRVEVERDRLLNDQGNLESLEDLVKLHFDRAEFERDRREQAERARRGLEQRNAELERQLGERRIPAKKEAGPKPATVVPEFINQDVHVEKPFKFSDSDFNEVHTLVLTYAWYCERCNKGGERSYERCPHCRREVSHDFPKTVTFRLPGEPRYGERMLRERGNSDNPKLSPSDVYIQVGRKPSFKERWRKA